MARRKGKLRADRVIVLYSSDEFDRLRQLFARSTNRTISGYVRRISLEEPVQVIHRNGSFDSFVDEITVLRKELAAIREQGALSPAMQERLLRLHENLQERIDQIVELCMPR